MDLSNTHRIVASPEAKFLIGRDRVEFAMRSQLVAVQSKPLSRAIKLLHGRFNDQPIIWRDVSVETYSCFSQYAFTGDYHGPKPTARFAPRQQRGGIKLRLTNRASEQHQEQRSKIKLRLTHRANQQHQEQRSDIKLRLTNRAKYACTGDYWGPKLTVRCVPRQQHQEQRGQIKLRLTNRGSLPGTSYSDFRWHTFLEEHPGYKSITVDEAVDTRTHSLEGVFLCHARVYLFADRFGITGLRDLAMSKLLAALEGMIFTTNVIPDVTQLARYIYTNTTLDRPAGKELRILVRTFAIYKLERMWHSTEFRDFALGSGFLNAIN